MPTTYTSKVNTITKIRVPYTSGLRPVTVLTGLPVIAGLGALFPRYDGYSYRGQQVLIVTVTAGSAYQIPNVNCDVIVIVNKIIAGATTILGRTIPTAQYTDTIKDGKGDAATNNITFVPGTGLVDNASTLVINTNLGAYILFFSGTDYFKK